MMKMNYSTVDSRQSNDVREVKEKIHRILSMISRDQMKVVFFGRSVD